MRIGIDARWIFPETSGIGTYTYELVRHLVKIDRENEYVVFFHDVAVMDRVVAAAGLDRASNFTPHRLPFDVFSPRGQVFFPLVLSKLALDVFHSPNYLIPLLAFPRGKPGRTRCVVTIHDLIPLIFPEFTPRAKKTRLLPVFRRLMAEVGRRADVILTVSQCSRRDVIREMHIPAAREGNVIAVPNGVAPEYKPAPRGERTTRTVLYVGRFDPYKNVVGLIETFSRVRDLAGIDVRLRIIGPQDARYPESGVRARELGLDKHIDWIGYAGGSDLLKEYQAADVFVLLSKYEGFGLTVLEAMACGTPVVCGNRSSLPEVAGGAAAMVDPENSEEAAQAIARVLEDSSHADDLRRRGLAQAAKFSWLRTAEQTLLAYQQAARLK